jgi:hypothetical protein
VRTPTAEDQIEYAVRAFPCPVCSVTPGERCLDDRTRVPYAHTGRYLVAVEAGAVRPFGGAS